MIALGSFGCPLSELFYSSLDEAATLKYFIQMYGVPGDLILYKGDTRSPRSTLNSFTPVKVISRRALEKYRDKYLN